MDKRVRIISVLALCVAIVCVATLITVVVVLFRHGRRREQVTAVDDVPSAISVTDSGLSQYSISSSILILP
uniref:Uncharacterized protein n=1 Tax=Setaria italica TaxID=4555 RepID=K3ZGF0_SETIT